MATRRAKQDRSETEESPPQPDVAGVPAPDDLAEFSDEILREYDFLPSRTRANAIGFLRTFVRFLRSQPNVPLIREMIQQELKTVVGRAPAQTTIDHLLQSAARAMYLRLVKPKTGDGIGWMAPNDLPSEQDMVNRLNSFSGHSRRGRQEHQPPNESAEDP